MRGIPWFFISNVLFSSCMSVTPHQVTLTASPTVRQEDVGQGQQIQLSVIDIRTEKKVGRWAGLIGASITAPQVIAYLEKQVTQGLDAKGFVVTKKEASRRMTLSLVRFAWEMRQSSGVARLGTAVDIKVEIHAPFAAPMTRFYIHDDHALALITPLSDEVDRRFNAGISNVLSQLFADTRLFAALTKAHN